MRSLVRAQRANENINFNSVTGEAGVAKATLYNHSDQREWIETLRQPQSLSLTQQQIKRKMNDNNKEALIESLKRKNKKLEIENKKLRE